MTSSYLFKSLTSLEINRRRKRSHGSWLNTYTSVEARVSTNNTVSKIVIYYNMNIFITFSVISLLS